MNTSTGKLGRLHDVRDDRVEGKARDRLLSRAWRVCHAIVEDPGAGPRAADAVAGSYAEEGLRNIRRGGRLLNRVLADHLITNEMVEEIYDQRPPRRTYAAPIARRAYGSHTFPLLVLGGLTVGFATFATAFTLTGTAGPAATLFFIPPCITGPICALLFRKRLRRRRLLIRGRPVDVTLSEVVSTGITSNNDAVLAVHFIPTSGSDSPLSMKVGSVAGRMARRMMEEGEVTRVLVDPTCPGQCLWLDGWALDALED